MICWLDVQFLSSYELGYMIEQGMRRGDDLAGMEEEIFLPIGGVTVLESILNTEK